MLDGNCRNAYCSPVLTLLIQTDPPYCARDVNKGKSHRKELIVSIKLSVLSLEGD